MHSMKLLVAFAAMLGGLNADPPGSRLSRCWGLRLLLVYKEPNDRWVARREISVSTVVCMFELGAGVEVGEVCCLAAEPEQCPDILHLLLLWW